MLAAISMGFGGLGCGQSPTAPDTMDFVTEASPFITVVPTAAVATAGAPQRAASGKRVVAATSDLITVTVQQVPSIQTTVMPGETAIITGLAPGSYTLVFTQNGITIGTQQVTGVQSGEQILITAVFDNGTFVMVVVIIGDSSPPCTLDGQVGDRVELEGDVVSGNGSAFRLDRKGSHGDDLFDVNAGSASYRCVGQAKGNCKATLGVGAQVHVKGTLAGCTATSVRITASEVKVQKP